MPVTQQVLTIGGIQLNGFEVPNQIPQLFGMQKMAIHDFPGGQRTIQNLGAFPFPHIEWTGQLFDGGLGANHDDNAQAMHRAEILNDLRMQALPTTMTWGAFSLQVVVAEFEIIGRLKQWLEYRIKIIPFQDNTPADPAANSAQATADLIAANNQFANATSSPASGYTFQSVITNQSVAIQQSIINALNVASQNLANVPAITLSAIQAQILVLQQNLASLTAGSNFAQVAAATQLFGAAGVLSEALDADVAGPIVVTVIDPNLYILAGQFYNDVNQAANIALANNLQDFVLTGSYTLTLPNVVP